MSTELYSLSDVARILGVQPHRVIYLLSTRQVAEPAMRIGGKRIFTTTDLSNIASKLDVEAMQALIDKDRRDHAH